MSVDKKRSMEAMITSQLLTDAIPSSESLFLDELSDFSFLMQHYQHILTALAGLLKLAAVEVYLKEGVSGNLRRIFHSGELAAIWEAASIEDPQGFLAKQLIRNEARTIHLPNRRISDINPLLREKAIGQIACFPIRSGDLSIGLLCAAHSRRNLLDENEIAMLISLSEWIGMLMELERKNQQVRAQIITDERERIGMDLHDGIIQSLYGIGLSMENARLNLDQEKGNASQLIEKSLEALQSAIADIRAYILDLRPRQLRHANLIEGMRSLIREFRANTMAEVHLEGSSQEIEGLAREQVDALYHIFQEALSNTAKHARATKVAVRLWRRGDRVLLRIHDNGQGFEVSPADHRVGHGLANMRVRAEAAGGGMEVVSIRRQGTTLTAWVPLTLEH